MRRRSTPRIIAALIAAVALAAMNGLPVHASSHRDGPLIGQDPMADSNDLFSWVGRDDSGAKVLNVIATYIPLEEPGGGPNYPMFSDDVRYEIHIENDAGMLNGSPLFAGRSNLSFYFNFKSNYQSTGTFLTTGVGSAGVGPIATVGDGYQNLTQTYSVDMVNDATGKSTDLGTGQSLKVPPDNTGHATPLYNQGGDGSKPAVQGATSTANLDPYTKQSVYTLSNGIKVFAGQRTDPFFADIAAIFDIASLRKPGSNTFAGYNTHAIAMQIPVSIAAPGTVPIVGVYTAASRRAVTVQPPSDNSLNFTPGFPYQQQTPGSLGNYNFGPWRQVSRLANPLFNEVLNPLSVKDRWNEQDPTHDAAYKQYADCPSLAPILNLVAKLGLPTCGYGLLDSIYIPDLLKVDTSTDPPRQDLDAGFSRLSVFGGDTINSPFQGKAIPSGWPNGRRPGDDVVDIAVTAVASGPTLSSIVPVGDNVDSNGMPFNQVFPYLQTPANGFNHAHHS